MGKSLKQKNQPQLITFVVLNALILGAVIIGIPHLLSIVDGMSKGSWAILGKIIAVPAALTVVTGILGWAMPRNWKESLVFWRTGKNCLPSSRAFSSICSDDARIDMDRLTARYGELPLSAAAQTSLWYKIYRTHSEDASVEDANSAYLRYREMTSLCLALFLCHAIACFWLAASVKSLSVGCSLLIAEYFLVMLAARHSAVHLVANVLAIESSVGA